MDISNDLELIREAAIKEINLELARLGDRFDEKHCSTVFVSLKLEK